jgi:hypothetical protein
MLRPKIRARYKVVGPKTVKRWKNTCFMDDQTKSLQQKKVLVEESRYMVYFPQGHSISLTKEGLIEHGLHRKPRLVDMNTGDVIDTGGDFYDFDNPIEDHDVLLADDDDPEMDVLVKEAIKAAAAEEADNSASKSKQKVT